MSPSQSAPIDAAGFKAAMQQLAATVTIVTTDVREPVGMTATAVMSVSASPPALVVSINRNTALYKRLASGALICVNALSNQHEEVCRAFGGGAPGPERFKMGAWRFDDARSPYLEDAVANIFCQVDQLVDYATHTLAISHVVGLRRASDRDPLLYLRGGFYGLQARREVWGMPF